MTILYRITSEGVKEIPNYEEIKADLVYPYWILNSMGDIDVYLDASNSCRQPFLENNEDLYIVASLEIAQLISSAFKSYSSKFSEIYSLYQKKCKQYDRLRYQTRKILEALLE